MISPIQTLVEYFAYESSLLRIVTIHGILSQLGKFSPRVFDSYTLPDSCVPSQEGWQQSDYPRGIWKRILDNLVLPPPVYVFHPLSLALAGPLWERPFPRVVPIICSSEPEYHIPGVTSLQLPLPRYFL